MKKILLFVLLIVSVIKVQARSFTINNTTSYPVDYNIGGAVSGTGPGCSTGVHMSGTLMISALSNITYANTSSLSWLSSPPIPSDWFIFNAVDINYPTCHSTSLFVCGVTNYCSLYATSTSFFSCTYGVIINYSWTEDPSGNVTITIF